MNSEERRELKLKLKNTKFATIKKTGKKPKKQEFMEAYRIMTQSMVHEKPKENWQGERKTLSIKEILEEEK